MTQAQLGPGSIVGGDFSIVAPLDEGGMGAVFIAEQRSTGKRRALKLMHREIVADPSFTKRFEQEAKVGSRIRSEHVVEVLAAGVDGPSGLPYLVMELLEGEDLRHRLKRGALAPDEVRVVFEQVCHAMAAAHASGVVHRDLKPENVFLATSLRAGGAPYVVKVLDFGIAKIQAEAGTRATRGAVGSPMWMAPEQTAPGPVTPAADVWAMGLLAYELFTGRSFWRAANESEGTTAQLLREIVLDPIPAPSSRAARADALPAGFDAWFARCVAREPLARFDDAAQLWRAMQALFGAPSLGPPQTVREAFEATADAVPYPEATTLPPVPTLTGPHLRAATPLEGARDVVPAPPRASTWPLAVAAVIAAGGIGNGGVEHARASDAGGGGDLCVGGAAGAAGRGERGAVTGRECCAAAGPRERCAATDPGSREERGRGGRFVCAAREEGRRRRRLHGSRRQGIGRDLEGARPPRAPVHAARIQ